jgi:hypothetical protein
MVARHAVATRLGVTAALMDATAAPETLLQSNLIAARLILASLLFAVTVVSTREFLFRSFKR